MSKHFRRLKVKKVIKETTEAVSIVFEIPDEIKQDFHYKAGQYLTIKAVVNGEEIRRSYSLSSSPVVENDLKITSKKVDQGRMSHFLYTAVKEGDVLEVMPPEGNFTIDIQPPNHKKYIFFAAGSGITPIISLLKTIVETEAYSEIALYYGNRDKQQIIFYDELNRLASTYSNRLAVQHILSKGEIEGGRSRSRIDKVIVDAVAKKNKDNQITTEYFVCGPEGMILQTKESLLQAGIDKKHIHIEYFSNSAEDKGKDTHYEGKVNEVTAILDDVEHQLVLQDGETILEAADRMGIDPPYSCQSGVCTTCKAFVKQGEVEMGESFGLDEDEIAEGYVLTCCSRPKSAGVIVSWDDV